MLPCSLLRALDGENDKIWVSDLTYFLFQYLISVRDETIPSQVPVGKQGPQRLNTLSKETTGVKKSQVDSRFC